MRLSLLPSYCILIPHVITQSCRARAVKGMHSKCIGLCPRRFESYRQRLAFLCLEAAARRAARHCCRVSCCRRLVVSVRRIFRVGGPAQLEEYLRRFSPFVYVSHPNIIPDDTVPEWLRGQTRNLLGSARASSSLVSVALFWLGSRLARCKKPQKRLKRKLLHWRSSWQSDP